MEQGNVFRRRSISIISCLTACLNPFGTGQCLSTQNQLMVVLVSLGLNPFGTGQCLSTKRQSSRLNDEEVSQSLWNRAMSFDKNLLKFYLAHWSQSLWNRAMSFDLYTLKKGEIYESQSLWNRAMSFDTRRAV